MARVAAGEMQAFEEIYARHYLLVYGYALKFTHDEEAARDICQVVFMDAWRAPQRYNAQCSLKTWLQVMAKHRAFEWWNRKRSTALSLDYTDVSTDNDVYEWVADEHATEQFEDVDRRDEYAQLLLALRQIPATLRQVLVLQYWQDMPGNQIAKRLGTTRGVIKTQAWRGRKLLRERLQASA